VGRVTHTFSRLINNSVNSLLHGTQLHFNTTAVL
jgi:hypothetical protein